MATLLEAYSKRLQIAESVYSKAHQGEKLDNARKIATAKCLQNVDKFMNEAFDNSVGTQRSDMGLFKKFCLNLTNVALPNLIAHDLVIVSPMSSMSGFITYINYTIGTNKGQSKQGDVLNNPFYLGTRRDGQQVPFDRDYTSSKVVETVTAATAGATYVLAWTPVLKGTFTDTSATPAVDYDVKVTHADGTVMYGNVGSDGKTVTFATALVAGDRVAYAYDNVVIPQNDLPIVNANMESIALVAKARRVAVYYSQIAAYQAKTDYGFDLGSQLAEKAVGELSYEIDTEITDLLIDNAAEDARLVWSKTLPIGVSKTEHYEGFSEMVEIGRKLIYDKTRRFAPNYMLVSSSLLPVLSFIKGWTAAPTSNINGPYFAGTLNGLKVFVTPNITDGDYVFGVNGSDMMSSAAVYAPYMAIVPTQLLGYADGGMSQGWSTLYDLKLLNKELLVKGKVTD